MEWIPLMNNGMEPMEWNGQIILLAMAMPRSHATATLHQPPFFTAIVR